MARPMDSTVFAAITDPHAREGRPLLAGIRSALVANGLAAARAGYTPIDRQSDTEQVGDLACRPLAGLVLSRGFVRLVGPDGLVIEAERQDA